ncbi:UNVERIFIED_CONTAM: hypothetical protein Sradi_0585000 [Sesamum radiatum]|uniref:Disease resistance R13L4/SHOC-2-like LRR domain-containing protein n=1 Tax=Sesamum radiatum TaxID=300843 RepID=A0AAW2VLA4_SESRA
MPPEITQLFHLRFLALKGRLKVLPSISKLENLQTLMIRVYQWERGDIILHLPIEMWQMTQLRHLIFSKGNALRMPLVAVPSGGQVLENLQTLHVNNFQFTSIELIPNLKKLRVHYDFEHRGTWRKYCLNNLIHLRQLETLNLMFQAVWTVNPFPPSFALPSSLKKLTLTSCGLPWQDMTVIRSLPNLEVLKLKSRAFIGEEWECCSEGEFPMLKFLLIERLNLKRWQVESSHFPCLVRLIIKICWELEEIPCEIGDIPTLELIEVGWGKKSLIDSVLLIQEEQRSLGNDVLQVRSLFR